MLDKVRLDWPPATSDVVYRKDAAYIRTVKPASTRSFAAVSPITPAPSTAT